ncbi:hypothetical protein GDO81_014863 [Engystomops pustulosus]|uniref:Uncharacterized protein n=1 Tax=Engystomops pustulosus TaxID=76066 RepID=A0AAV7AM78_ENGPU|nr:hypothetical protein GDO81_014863 [Engystomops pustulosus]
MTYLIHVHQRGEKRSCDPSLSIRCAPLGRSMKENIFHVTALQVLLLRPDSAKVQGSSHVSCVAVDRTPQSRRPLRSLTISSDLHLQMVPRIPPALW